MSEPDSIELANEYLQTGDEGVLVTAFSTAKRALASADPTSPEYSDRVAELAQVMLVYFGAFGNFAVIDCAVEMLRRRADLGLPPLESAPTTFNLLHPTWEGGSFARSISDPQWMLAHPDGRLSRIWKDWAGWNGDGWPMGWNVQRPDGVVIGLEEDQWGDGWQLVGVPEPELPAVRTGEAIVGGARGTYEATAEGLRFVPLVGAPFMLRASEVSVVRVAPINDDSAFVMFARGMDADDVFHTISFLGPRAAAHAAEVGFMLGARVFGEDQNSDSRPLRSLSQEEATLLDQLEPQELLCFECLFGLVWRVVAEADGRADEDEDALFNMLLDGELGRRHEMWPADVHEELGSTSVLAQAVLSAEKRDLLLYLSGGNQLVHSAIDADIHFSAFIDRAVSKPDRDERIANCRGLFFEVIHHGLNTARVSGPSPGSMIALEERQVLTEFASRYVAILSETPLGITQAETTELLERFGQD